MFKFGIFSQKNSLKKLNIFFCEQQAVANPKFKLDWTVKFSFIIDLIKGLTYIHNSPLKLHGRLTSLCCFIDAAFLVKLTDYGMDAFYDLTVAELWGARRDPEYRMAQIWKAPEHLVNEASTQTEVINSVSAAGDIYSCGIIMQEIILRLPPFGMFQMETGGKNYCLAYHKVV
jgi:guanylate cyclase 2F